MATVATLSGVSFELPNGRELFSKLEFSLDDQLTALVGVNGAGKTCLARLLVGELTATTGWIRRHEPLTLFRQREAPPRATVAEYLVDADTWSGLGARLLEGVPLDSPCDELSGGQWMRARLVRSLAGGFLVLDEPTNDLDRAGRQLFKDYLLTRTGGALLISHDRECLSLCRSVLELSNRGLARFAGTWEDYEQYHQEERDGLEAKLEREKRARDRAREQANLQRERQERRNRHGQHQASRGGMPKILLGARKSRAQSTTGKRELAASERLDDAVRSAERAYAALKLEPIMYADIPSEELPAQKLVAEARELNLCFARWLYAQDLSFSFRGSVRVLVQGGNGSGKSTLLRALRGEPLTRRGELRRGELRTLYIDQRLAQLDDTKSVFDNVRTVCALPDSELRNGLARFLFAKQAVFQRVGELSGGERLRAALAHGFLRVEKPELLLLDEPTNNLDLPNIEFLEGVVRTFRGALLLVSHDETFVQGCGVTQALTL